MALVLGDNFSYQGSKPLDARLKYDTVANMKAVADATMYDGCIAYCVEADKTYQWKSTNSVDETLGKWREYSSGGGGGASSLDDLSDVNLSNPTDGQLLKYDAQSGKWINGSGGSATVAELGDIQDVNLTNIADGQIIKWDATNSKWVNANLPTVPTKTSDLTNDSGFITKVVNDLVNYYLKSETYSKTEVDNIATAIKNSRFEVVATLPTSDIKTNVIYLVPKAESESGDIKDEYINLDGTTAGWERIGSTDIDLSGYVTTTALNTALANYTTTTDLTALLAGKQDKVQYSALPTASAELEGKIFEYTGATSNGLTHGYFYECVSDGENPATYSWVQTNVQPSGGGGGSSDYNELSNKPSIEGVTLYGNKTASDLGLDKVRELTQAQYAALSEQEKMNGTSYFITDGEGGGAYSIQKATLQAGATTVTFTVPTTGDYILDVYTSDGRNYSSVDMSVSGSVTLTFDAPSSAVTVYLELKGV